jgi:DNA-binding NtrC family response regulator
MSNEKTRGPGRPEKPAKVQKAEARAIKAALRKFQGNANRAARELGLARRTLYHRCAKYGIDPNDFRPAGWTYEGPFGTEAAE